MCLKGDSITIDIRLCYNCDFNRHLEIVKQHCPNAIWAVETRFEMAEKAIEFLKKNKK